MTLSTTTSRGLLSSTSFNNSSDIESLGDEDSRFLLQTLEKQAFEQVVYALRAQGPLTQYKESLLGHIKSALFIDDAEFCLRVRLAVNNKYLTRIAQQLNPLCDNCATWSALGQKFSESYDVTKAPIMKMKNNSVANKMNVEMKRHNKKATQNPAEALMRLRFLPKKPYVPERLRVLLHESDILESRVNVKEEGSLSDAKFRMTKIDSDISRPKVREIKEIEGPVPVKRRIGRPPKKKNIRVDNFAQRDAKNDIAMPDMLSNLATVSERFSPIMVSDRYPSQNNNTSLLSNRKPVVIAEKFGGYDSFKVGSSSINFDAVEYSNVNQAVNSCARIRPFEGPQDKCLSTPQLNSSYERNGQISHPRNSYVTRKSASSYYASPSSEGHSMTSPVPRKRYRTNSDSECVTESLMARKKSENHPEILYVPRSIHSSNDMTSCVVQNRVLSPVLTDGLTLAPCSSGTQDPLDENRLTATGILYGNEAGESSNNQLNDLFFIECPANVDCKNGIITGYPNIITDNEITLESSSPYNNDVQNHVIIDDDVEETCLDAEGRSVDLSALDFLASTASLMAPIETKRKSDEIEPGSNLALAPAPKRKNDLSKYIGGYRSKGYSDYSNYEAKERNNQFGYNTSYGLHAANNISNSVNHTSSNSEATVATIKKRGRPPKNKKIAINNQV